MKISINKLSEKRLLLFAVLFGVGLFYTFRATASGLWYDESIEYFYSKVMSGAVPGGRGTMNMYERIVSTFQPPLYNILMYLWLLVFDSEFGFRMAGVLTTLVGGIGFYLAIDKLADRVWAVFGTLSYLLTSKIIYYALECGEYNLMLCFMCWTLFFFICAIKDERVKDLIGFFACACLTVYSQYGSVFIIAILYLAVVIHFLRKKKMKKELIILSAITAVLAGALLGFFMLPQMMNQGASEVSHMPAFAHNNIIVDFVIGLGKQMGVNFGAVGLGVVMLFALFTILGLFQKKPMLKSLVLIVVISWVFYYLTVACSFYGYNAWDNSYGTQNIGNRYGVFFIPLWLLTVIYGSYLTFCWLVKSNKIKSKCWVRVIATMLVVCSSVYSAFGMISIIKRAPKDDVREITATWYKEGCYNESTLVHEWSDANFRFYLIHDNQYKSEYQDNIVTAEMWIRNATEVEMKENLTRLGYLDCESFYYIAPAQTYIQSYNAFIAVMNDNGYTVEKAFGGENSVMLHATKKP